MSLDPYYHYHSEKASIVGALIIVADLPRAITTIIDCTFWWGCMTFDLKPIASGCGNRYARSASFSG